MSHKVKFYPVENGDTTLITLSDKTTILTDCKLRVSAEDPDDDSKFDVKKDLLKSISYDNNNNPFIDVFILSHADKDHCHGFEKHFYSGNPNEYSIENREKNEIIIGELWITSMLFTLDQSDDANSVRKEANRRIKMQDDNHIDKEKHGNAIRLIGYDSGNKFNNIKKYVPSNIVDTFNGKVKNNFSLFIHAPFKDDLITCKAEQDRNSSSIVYQARFKINTFSNEFDCRIMMGGDADHYIWEQILKKSEANGNNAALKYNIFLAPHHCSWTFFNDVPYEATESNKIPKDNSLKMLDYALTDAFIIASSRRIINEKPNPPHYSAQEEYKKKLSKKSNFLNTAVEPNKENPLPIEFIIEPTGPKRLLNDDTKATALFGISQTGCKPWSE